MPVKSLARLVMLILSFLALPLSAQTLQFRTLENPPLEYIDKQGHVAGIAADIVREAVRRTGNEVDIRIYPWKRVIQEVSQGHADAAFNAGLNDERRRWGLYPRQVLINETYVLFASKRLEMGDDLSAFSTMRLGTQLGYFYGPDFQAHLDDGTFGTVETVPSIAHNLRKLVAGRIDLFVGDLLPTRYYLDAMGLHDQVHVVTRTGSHRPAVISVSPTYVAFSRLRTDPAYVQRFSAALEAMKKDHTYERIIQRYLPDVELPKPGVSH